MKELVEYIAKSLVDNPDEVSVVEVRGGQTTVLEMRVAHEDMGKIIGRQGRVAKAIRTLMKIAATKEGKRAILDILRYPRVEED